MLILLLFYIACSFFNWFLHVIWLWKAIDMYITPVLSIFPKIIKNDIFTEKKHNITFLLFSYVCLYWDPFSLVLTMDKMPFPTFQDLSVVILYVKTRQFLQIWKNAFCCWKKCVFSLLYPYGWKNLIKTDQMYAY